MRWFYVALVLLLPFSSTFAEVVVTSRQSDCIPDPDGHDDVIEIVVRDCDLIILHEQVLTNCCLEYNPRVEVEGSAITVVEVDTGPPCDCICPFDLEIVISGLEPGTYTIDMDAFLHGENLTYTVTIPPCGFGISSPEIWATIGTAEVEMPVYASNSTPLQGFSFGTVYRLDTALITDITIDGTITEAVGAELVYTVIFTGDHEADGFGWATISVILDVEEPFGGQTIPAGSEQHIATFVFDIPIPEGTIYRSMNVPFEDDLGTPPVDTLFVVDDMEVFPTKSHGQIQLSPPSAFIRGDINDTSRINISDPVYLLSYLFSGGDEPPCEDAADVNDDGLIDISDVVSVLGYLFSGGEIPPPTPPEPEGFDPTLDTLGCDL